MVTLWVQWCRRTPPRGRTIFTDRAGLLAFGTRVFGGPTASLFRKTAPQHREHRGFFGLQTRKFMTQFTLDFRLDLPAPSSRGTSLRSTARRH